MGACIKTRRLIYRGPQIALTLSLVHQFEPRPADPPVQLTLRDEIMFLMFSISFQIAVSLSLFRRSESQVILVPRPSTQHSSSSSSISREPSGTCRVRRKAEGRTSRLSLTLIAPVKSETSSDAYFVMLVLYTMHNSPSQVSLRTDPTMQRPSPVKLSDVMAAVG